VRFVLLAPLILLVVVWSNRPAAAQGQAPPPVRSQPARTSSSPSQPLSSATFLGGVPSGAPTATVVTIGILDAMNRALEHNLGVLLAEQQIGRAGGARWRALSEILPNVSGRVSETRQQINLQAFGFSGFGPGFGNIPNIVGPFNVFDARLYLSQSLLDLGALNNARAEAHNVQAARHTYKGARDLVVWVAGTLYLQALAGSARADSARAQQETAQALYKQAVDLKQGGLVAGIDVLRAEVALNAETQRFTVAANDAEKAKLQLARVIGLPLGQPFVLEASLPELPIADMTLEQAIDRAYGARADYQAALERVSAAEAARKAIIGEHLPAIRLNADVGDIGLSPSDSHGTFSVTGAVQIPIFQGGRTRGRLLEADADLRNRRAEADDMRAAIYYEVRTAFMDLQSTTEQLQVATKARDLAGQQLVQSRDRFGAGVVSNIEVVQAQEAVAVANEQYISAQYGYDLAKGALIRGVGSAEQTLRQFLGGTR
jgi:outer membrane protein TolC